MTGYTDKIKQISERLLKEGIVESVIGFKKGTLPMMNEPCLVTQADQAADLVWDSNCGINLANYLTDRKEKIGVIAKGCDSRNMVTHIIENKIKKDQLYIIGVPCQGMLDRRKAEQMAAGEILSVTEDAETVTIAGNSFEKTAAKKELLQNNCAVCVHRNPVIYDELVGELVEEQKDVKRFEELEALEAMSPQEKWDFFEELLAPCTRCYACRNACPLCYCPTCFVDESKPQWVGKSDDKIDIRTFHLLRAFHCAGRCTDCGACERACPQGIKVRLFTKKLEKDCLELFGWEAGLTLEERPPLDTYKVDDPEGFIK